MSIVLPIQNINSIKAKKNNEKITMITAYDALFSSLFDGLVDIILVGDSLEMSFGGHQHTLKATLNNMIYHANAVCSVTKHSLVVLDMPFGSVCDKKTALKNAIKVFKKTNVHAIKIEGGEKNAKIIKHLCQNGIAVMGHIGLLPQNVKYEGGYKVKGREEKELKCLLKDAKALQDAGVFCIVIEGVISEVAKQVAKSVDVPLIGIGAGREVDGQVLVWSDAFGFFEKFKPKFVRKYLDGAKLIKDALNEYVHDVKNENFPSIDEEYQK